MDKNRDNNNAEINDNAKKPKRDLKLLFIRLLLVGVIVGVIGKYAFDKITYYNETKKLEALKLAADKKAEEERKAAKLRAEQEKKEQGNNEEEEPPYISPIDFDYWKGINKDVIGYIKIPDTKVDYPILYDANDNERYLHESIDGKETVHGSIYLDNLASPDFTSKNNMIYGHHMKDGSMFKDVVKYKNVHYLKEHQTVYLYLPDREIKLRAVAAFYETADGSSRRVKFDTPEEFSAFANSRLSNSDNIQELPKAGVDGISQLFCLVTCSYEFVDARTFLYCIPESDYNDAKE